MALIPTLLLLLAAAVPTSERVASCTLASDETLLDILSRAGHVERLRAVSTLADDPSYSNAGKVPDKIQGRCGGELESLLKLKPDLAIIASYNKPEMAARLQAAGVRTYALGGFETLNDIEAHITDLGALVHAEKEAAALRAEFQQERARLTRPKPTHVQVLHFYPDGSTSGTGTLFDELVRTAGGENAAALAGLKAWPRVSTELLAALRPDVVIAAGEATARDQILKTLRSTAGWKEIPAVKAGSLLIIPERELGAVSHHILKALAKIRAEVDRLQAAKAGKDAALPGPP